MLGKPHRTTIVALPFFTGPVYSAMLIEASTEGSRNGNSVYPNFQPVGSFISKAGAEPGSSEAEVGSGAPLVFVAAASSAEVELGCTGPSAVGVTEGNGVRLASPAARVTGTEVEIETCGGAIVVGAPCTHPPPPRHTRIG